jgi:DNA-binding phage protein
VSQRLNERAAQRVRATLGVRNRSVRWLASQTGIAPQTLSRKINGKTDFSLDELAAVATALGLNLVALITDEAFSLDQVAS